jgi:hypothetical protein
MSNILKKEPGTQQNSFKSETTTCMLPKTNWNSIYTASILSFVGTVQFSLYFSSMWPYVQIVEKNKILKNQ